MAKRRQSSPTKQGDQLIRSMKRTLLWIAGVVSAVGLGVLLIVVLVVNGNSDRIDDQARATERNIIGNCYDFNVGVDRTVANDVEQARANARGLVIAQKEIAGVDTPKEVLDRYLEIVSAEAEATSRENNPYRKCTLEDQLERLNGTPANVGCTGPAELGYCLTTSTEP